MAVAETEETPEKPSEEAVEGTEEKAEQPDSIEAEQEVQFSWTGEAESVSVRGDFNNWADLKLTKRSVDRNSLCVFAGN